MTRAVYQRAEERSDSPTRAAKDEQVEALGTRSSAALGACAMGRGLEFLVQVG